MRVVGLVLRFYSYLFHLFLALAMLAVASVAWLSGNPLEIAVLPWTGPALVKAMFFGGLLGLILTVLAMKRILPVLFVLWAAVVLVMAVKGFFFSSYTFGPAATPLSTALWFILAALVALVGSLFGLRRQPAAIRRKSALA